MNLHQKKAEIQKFPVGGEVGGIAHRYFFIPTLSPHAITSQLNITWWENLVA